MNKKANYKSCIPNEKQVGFLIIFLCVIFSSFSQIEFQTQEKIYLHIDKSEYYAGEDIWFKAYLVNGETHSSKVLSKVVYVELLTPNDSILSRKTIKIANGGGHGDFNLPLRLETGAYTIRAYTNYMRNFDEAYFFRKSIFIKSLKPATSVVIVETIAKPDLQFFPEGGYLVNDFLNQVGFKAIDSNGNGVDVKGTIIDNLGNEISKFESSHLGMGVFHFIPKKGFNYKVRINYNQEELVYVLPKSKPTGILIKVIEYKDDYGIYLLSSLANELRNFTLLGSQRNGVIFNSKIEIKGSQAVVNVPKSILKEGIVQFTLLDNHKTPILERLAFYETEEKEVQLKITPSKGVLEARELVELEISLDTILKSNLSVAVTDMSSVKFNKYDLDIKSQLLLNSELKGAIEQPGYYFYSDHLKRKEHLDILMMTQGWRQFIWNAVLDGNEQSKKYAIEQGFSFKGKVKRYSNRSKAESAMVSLMIRNDEFLMDETLSNTDGYFEFGDYAITDSTSIIIQAQSPRSKKRSSKNSLKNLKTNYYIELDTFAPAALINKNHLVYTNDENDINQYSIALKNQLVESSAANDKEKDRIKLDEVTLKADVGLKKYDTYIKNKQLYRAPSQRVDFAEIGNLTTGNILRNLDGRIAGLTIKYLPNEDELVAYFNRSQTSIKLKLPLYLLDGMPVSVDAIKMIPMSEILFVDVLKGAKATIYGTEAAHGVIAVYTKDGSEDKSVKNKKRRGIINFIHPGYSQARNFYEPVYKTKKKVDDQFDYRSTIYWNPILKFYESGKVKVSFYTADIETTYRVDIQGMTAEGQILKAEAFLNVE